MSASDGAQRPERVSAASAYDGRSDPFAVPPHPSWVSRTFPLIETLRGYSRSSFRVDAVAGVTVAALAIPSGMGYASIAGLPVQAGLYALLLPILVYALMSSSARAVIGPEGAIAAMVASALAPLAVAGSAEYVQLAAALAILVGLIHLAARLARVGKLTDFMSVAVLVGYISGIAVVLVVGQLGKLTGIPVEGEDTLRQLLYLVTHLADLHPLTTLVGVSCLVILVAARRFLPRIPAALVVVISSIALSSWLDWAAQGVATVGQVPPGLPIPGIPWEGLARTVELLPAAVGIFFVAYSDSILTARSFASRHHESVDSNSELTALGSADIAAGLTGAFPLGISGSRTSVNDQMKARTQVGQLVAVAVVAAVLLFLTEPIQYLPSPVLAAIIIVAASSLISLPEWHGLARGGRAEVGIAAVTAAGVILVGVIPALIVAMLLSLIDFARRASQARDAVEGWVDGQQRYADISRAPEAEITPGVVVYRYDSRLFYANAGHFKERVLAAVTGAPYPVHTVILDAAAFTDTDVTAAAALEEVVGTLEEEGITLAVAELRASSRDEFEELGLVRAIGSENFHPTVEAAVFAAQSHRTETAPHDDQDSQPD